MERDQLSTSGASLQATACAHERRKAVILSDGSVAYDCLTCLEPLVEIGGLEGRWEAVAHLERAPLATHVADERLFCKHCGADLSIRAGGRCATVSAC